MKLKTYDDRLTLTNGNYHSLVNARKPKGIEDKRAYLVGTGIGALAAGCFLIRDAHMDGSKITFYEQLDIPGGSLDGNIRENMGYVARGGREMGHHFEVLWSLFSSLPSTEDPTMSVLDHFYYTNLDDPNSSNCRITEKQGMRYDDGKFNLGQDLAKELAAFTSMSDEELENKAIEEIFSEELLNTDFWTYWRTMFAFENWHSALEMKLYMNRFIHHVDGLPDLSALQFSRHDQYTSFVKPMIKYLEDHNANFEYGVTVNNVEFSISDTKKVAKRIEATAKDGEKFSVDLTENDLVFITNGSMTEGSGYGSDNSPAPFNKEATGCWELWRNIAAQSPEFGNPDKFCTDTEKSSWESCTITAHDERVARYIEKITKRSPYGGRTVTGGIITAQDSSWLMSWTVNRQEQYYGQPKKDIVFWVYGLFSDIPGDYIKKPLRDCTGKEITKEWLYHIGVPTNEIEELAESLKEAKELALGDAPLPTDADYVDSSIEIDWESYNGEDENHIIMDDYQEAMLKESFFAFVGEDLITLLEDEGIHLNHKEFRELLDYMGDTYSVYEWAEELLLALEDYFEENKVKDVHGKVVKL